MMKVSSILERISLPMPTGVPGSAVPAILVGLFVALGGVLFGYDTGNINGILAMEQFRNQFSTGYADEVEGQPNQPDLTARQKALIVSILSAGTFFGALLAAPVADKIGRRYGLMVSCLIFIVGASLQVASVSIPVFAAGRCVAGLGVGMLSTLIPLYQAETAPKWIRGAICSAFQFAITFGLFLAAIVDNATKDRTNAGAYRIPLMVQLIWAVILILGMTALPETPRYLIKRDRHEDAARSLARLRRLPLDSRYLAEIAEIAEHHEHELNLGGSSYLDCFKGSLGKRLLTGCLLQVSQQLTGINFIFYYGTSYFLDSGMGDPFTITMITNSVNVISTIPGLLMIERWGRRPLLLFGGVGMAVSQFLVAGLGTGLAQSDATNTASTVLICLFVFFYACSWGPVVWVVPGEIFSLKVRAKSMSISTASNWLVNFALAYSVPFLIETGTGNLHLQARLFFIWASFCVLACVIVWCLVYETKGLSLEQVDEMYAEIDRAWESHHFQAVVALRNSQRRSVNSQTQPWVRHSTKTPSYSVHVEASPPSTLEDNERHLSRSSRGTVLEHEPSIMLRQFP
ncbi:sugar transporter, putative [Talaromyces stipitatus ATCC 10500]|uniref:Sugar transporter, putative n=1 Tax=Talaromyces stipitatus (strain ATCC 10500 / CBS 375.48 / QM 6759 / NRRL 1006) TaxID=441959 RepID=B8M517_TALSN|nr:sugar transporter, putative [Talaromyces stipitatus ATCC 10500]EED19623.1 sugar transporter, putative [Talaromyces stipitatus ATCC 10500]